MLISTRCLIKQIIAVGGCIYLGATLAGGTEEIPPITTFPYTPGVSLYGLGGNGWTATGDVMLPVLGRSQNFAYIDPQIYYHNDPDSFTASAGTGQRWLLSEDAGILGAYVFGDYNHSNDGNSFWFVSPGIERLSDVFDFSLNGYIPVSTQRINNGLEFADESGNFSQITFTGHTQYDAMVNTFDATGWGLDGQVGVRLPFRNAKVYLGGYYFAPKDSNTVGGGAIRAEVPINDFFSVTMSEAYDSEFHNTLKAGLTLWFGGRHTSYHFNGDLSQRMVDPIQRNLVATAGGANTAQPILQSVENTGQINVEMDNISFFVPNTSTAPTDNPEAVQGDGTYENPYIGMTQDNVNDGNIQNNRTFYINSGNYEAEYNPVTNPNFIVLNNDQLYGRTDYFQKAATGANRPVINFTNGGFEVPLSNVNDSFTGLQLVGASSSTNGDFSSGIYVNHDSAYPGIPNLTVNISDISVQNFGDGIKIINGAGNTTVNIDDTTITNNTAAYSESVSGGIAALNSGPGTLSVTISNSFVTNNTTTGDPESFGGILLNNSAGNSTMTVNNTEITGNIIGVNVIGNNAVMNINNSDVEQNPMGVSASINSSITMNNSTVIENGIGLNAETGGSITIINPTLFNDMVIINGGTLSFPGITPANGDTVICTYGVCDIA